MFNLWGDTNGYLEYTKGYSEFKKRPFLIVGSFYIYMIYFFIIS